MTLAMCLVPVLMEKDEQHPKGLLVVVVQLQHCQVWKIVPNLMLDPRLVLGSL